MAASDVLIALIGPSWLQVAGRDGQPRIADAEDWVAREITFALERGIWIVPVLGDGVAMPTAADLPPSLVALARRNAVHVRHESFPVDVDYLLTVPDRTLRPAASEPPSLAEPSRARFAAAHKPVHLLHTQRLDLAGRDELLATMHSWLTSPGPMPRQLALHGLGGVGKTSLMREYAHRHAADYNMVFEVSADNPAARSTGFAKLAHLLGVADESDATDRSIRYTRCSQAGPSHGCCWTTRPTPTPTPTPLPAPCQPPVTGMCW